MEARSFSLLYTIWQSLVLRNLFLGQCYWIIENYSIDFISYSSSKMASYIFLLLILIRGGRKRHFCLFKWQNILAQKKQQKVSAPFCPIYCFVPSPRCTFSLRPGEKLPQISHQVQSMRLFCVPIHPAKIGKAGLYNWMMQTLPLLLFDLNSPIH